jgi:hypothetical protein
MFHLLSICAQAGFSSFKVAHLPFCLLYLQLRRFLEGLGGLVGWRPSCLVRFHRPHDLIKDNGHVNPPQKKGGR